EEPAGNRHRQGRLASPGGRVRSASGSGAALRDPGQPPASGHRGERLAATPRPARSPRIPGCLSSSLEVVVDLATTSLLAELAAEERLAEANLLLARFVRPKIGRAS